MRKHFFNLVLCLTFIGFQNSIFGQTTTEAPTSFFQHFAQQTEVPTLTIDTDVKKLIKDKRKETYQGASITFNGLEGEIIEMDAKIRTRGNIRKEVCYFPPVKLKMKKKALEKLGFDTLNQVKMVIQCQSNKQGLSYLLKENLIYQLHQPIGPISYQTKLIKLNLIDKKGGTQELFAFLIEEEKEFCARLESQIPPGKSRITSRLIDRGAYLKMVFFQYMILNTDWQMANRHNLEFVQMKGQDKFMPIPYDFDYSGMVGTSYAVPDASRGIKSVLEPCFLGKDVTEEEAQATADYFISKKEAVYAALEADQHLSTKDGKAIRKRLDFFFKEIESKRIIKNTFSTGK